VDQLVKMQRLIPGLLGADKERVQVGDGCHS
jgi:hypothetical protein